MARTKKPPEETKQQRYEASGKRPGTPVSTRLEEGPLKLLDAKRGKVSRSAYVQALIFKAVGWNAEPQPPNPPRKHQKR